MRVSVIIPNYNYGNFIHLAINSLLAQTDTVDEIIVVDDGSTDNSREVLEAYGDKIIAVFQENGGQASAINNGYMRSAGDIVCILDSDDIFFPDKVRTLKEIYEARPEAQWVFHTLKHMSPDDAENVTDYPRFKESVTLDVIDEASLMRRGKSNYDAPATSGLSFRRSFMSEFFPLPVAKSVYISDHYIKFYALARSKGISVAETLGGQIIHGNNLYTGAKIIATRARIFTNTGYFLYQKLPEIKAFCTNLVAEGLICAKKAGISGEVKDVVGKYLKYLTPFELLIFKLKVVLKQILRNIP